MKSKLILKLTIVLISLLLLPGCKESLVDSDVGTSDVEALKEIAFQDSSVLSFEMNYNEDNEMFNLFGKTNVEIFPLRVGRKITSFTRNFSVQISGDTAYGVMTHTCTGILFIAASYDSVIVGDSTDVDTLIQKPFTAIVTRNLIFVKIANTNRPRMNWRLAAHSLAKGGTNSSNIDIKNLAVFLPNGDSLVINDPLNYYLQHSPGKWRQLPTLYRGQNVTIEAKVFSAYEENDFVTLTFGADLRGHHRAKKRFEFINSVSVAGGFLKTYRVSFTTHQFVGFYCSVIDAMPFGVLRDDSAPVESSAWGVPYIVKN